MSTFTAAASALSGALLLTAAGLYVATLLPGDGGASANPAASYTAPRPAPPRRLVVPSLRIDTPVVPLDVGQDDVLDPPADRLAVAWWDGSAKAGAATGQTVVTGHTSPTGAGPLNDIDRLTEGQLLDVITARGTMRYEVAKVRTLTNAEVAGEPDRLFGQDHGKGRLVLVSREGFDGTTWTSSVVVLAHPLGQPAG